MTKRPIVRKLLFLALIWLCLGLTACTMPSRVYRTTKRTVKGTYRLTKGVTKWTLGTGEVVYTIGRYTFRVARAPMDWSLTHREIERIDNLSPKEAIRQGRVKSSPYTVHGRRYYPMSVEEALRYKETGVASWYGQETRRKKGGRMTANGEAFVPEGLTAAHRLLPLPTFVRVTNLENRRHIIVRVNDRGPFVKGRLIDLSAGAARRLRFYDIGTARVLVQTVHVE
jgi:rare lipoprotein A